MWIYLTKPHLFHIQSFFLLLTAVVMKMCNSRQNLSLRLSKELIAITKHPCLSSGETNNMFQVGDSVVTILRCSNQPAAGSRLWKRVSQNLDVATGLLQWYNWWCSPCTHLCNVHLPPRHVCLLHVFTDSALKADAFNEQHHT